MPLKLGKFEETLIENHYHYSQRSCSFLFKKCYPPFRNSFLFEYTKEGFELNDHKKNRITFFLGCLFLVVIASVYTGTAKGTEKLVPKDRTIVFTTIYPETISFFTQMSTIYSEAFGRLGYNFKLISQPGERALVDANQGTVDGEAGRIDHIDKKKYANLVRVPYPIATIKDGAYSTDHSIKINGWESLRGATYKVGLLKGIKSIEQKLPLYVDKTNIVTLGDVEQCLRMLSAKRINVFIIGTQIEDSKFMQNGTYKDVELVGIVEEKTIYPWLNKRHKELVPQLVDTLKAMKSEGWFQKLSGHMRK